MKNIRVEKSLYRNMKIKMKHSQQHEQIKLIYEMCKNVI